VTIYNYTKKEDSVIQASMLSKSEISYLNTIGTAFGGGRILELGCWLGSSTRCFLDKLTNGELHTCDLFKWREPYMTNAYPGKCPYKEGDSFLDEWKRNVDWQQPNHYVHPAGIEMIDWCYGQIDVLFIDAHKTWHIAKASFPKFLPSMVPGSLIIDQDFGWLPFQYVYSYLTYWRLREYLKPTTKVGTTAVFEVQKVIPFEMVEYATNYRQTTAQEILCALHTFHVILR